MVWVWERSDDSLSRNEFYQNGKKLNIFVKITVKVEIKKRALIVRIYYDKMIISVKKIFWNEKFVNNLNTAN